MTKPLQTTRTCVVCGQKKPLVAFLELAGTKGHAYGNICSTCRSAGLGSKKPVDIENAEKSGTSTRLQIDNKARVQLEQEKMEQFKQTAELEYEDKIKKETTEAEKLSETERRESAEKKHRESYLEKKQGLASSSTTWRQPPTAPKEAQKTQAQETQKTQKFYQEKERVSKEIQAQADEQQLGKKTSGISAAYVQKIVSATGGRSAESVFGLLLGQFLRNTMKGTPTGQVLEQYKQSPESKAAEPATAKEQPLAKTEGNDNIAAEFTKNNFRKR